MREQRHTPDRMALATIMRHRRAFNGDLHTVLMCFKRARAIDVADLSWAQRELHEAHLEEYALRVRAIAEIDRIHGTLPRHTRRLLDELRGDDVAPEDRGEPVRFTEAEQAFLESFRREVDR